MDVMAISKVFKSRKTSASAPPLFPWVPWSWHLVQWQKALPLHCIIRFSCITTHDGTTGTATGKMGKGPWSWSRPRALEASWKGERSKPTPQIGGQVRSWVFRVCELESWDFGSDYFRFQQKKMEIFHKKYQKGWTQSVKFSEEQRVAERERDPGIAVQPSVSEFEDPNFWQFHMAQKTLEKLRTTTNSAMLAVGGGLKIPNNPKESHQKWHAKEGFLLMATRNPANSLTSWGW